MLTLATPEEATAVEEHFNGFHDGFVESIQLRSLDRFTDEGAAGIGHETTGAFEITIVFAHYNYGGTLQPIESRVRAEFLGVSDFALDLRGRGPESWPIQAVTFDHRSAGFDARFTWHELHDGDWIVRDAAWFHFASATFDEESAGG